MSVEEQLAHGVVDLRPGDVPASARSVLRHMVMAVVGTGLAGAGEDGVAALRELLLEAGGAPQATTLVFGDRLPAAAAAQFNATMCRALDFCDAMAPGPHFGAALLPAALAAAELAGGCRGSDFLTALAAGAEVGARMNLSETQYDGFDPTGIAVVFAATAAAARLLGLDAAQTLHALALAFNRCGGSFQSHVDGSLGVRFVQGWVAQAGVQCAQLARRGVTGPHRFLSGHYGYAHLYGRGSLDPDSVVEGLGRTWRLERMVFKKYPSCGVTQGVTELALALVREHGLRADDVVSAEVRLPPYAHRLVGHAFKPGGRNPRVDAQFSAAYCVANALVRGHPGLAHFAPDAVADAGLRERAASVRVIADPALDARGHTAVDLHLNLRDGRAVSSSLDIAPGFPGASLTEAEHRSRLQDCLAYAPWPPSPAGAKALLAAFDDLETMGDVRDWLPLMITRGPDAPQ